MSYRKKPVEIEEDRIVRYKIELVDDAYVSTLFNPKFKDEIEITLQGYSCHGRPQVSLSLSSEYIDTLISNLKELKRSQMFVP